MSLDNLTRRNFLKAMGAGAAGTAVFGPQILVPKRAHAQGPVFNLASEVARIERESARVPDWDYEFNEPIGYSEWSRSGWQEVIDAAKSLKSETPEYSKTGVSPPIPLGRAKGTNWEVIFASGSIGDLTLRQGQILYVTGQTANGIGNTFSAEPNSMILFDAFGNLPQETTLRPGLRPEEVAPSAQLSSILSHHFS